MYYQIKHLTSYRYSNPIRESQMEVRVQPRNEERQRCWSFRLLTAPRVEVFSYPDPLGNTVHHFDIPGPHSRLAIRAESLVEILEMPAIPVALPANTWLELKEIAAGGEHWDDLAPSQFARPTNLLSQFAREKEIGRRDDPLTTLKALNTAIHDGFAYVPKSTKVDSPIDHALDARQGVCQDFAHIMIALVRGLGIPCRYVSGYLFHGEGSADRSAEDATHAWVEAFLPWLGWVGFDPTNDLIVGDRHIRAAVGRDYADVPPTRGVFKSDGRTDTELSVAVQVAPSDAPPPVEPPVLITSWATTTGVEEQSQQQQQQ